jgi:hypothetical protein
MCGTSPAAGCERVDASRPSRDDARRERVGPGTPPTVSARISFACLLLAAVWRPAGAHEVRSGYLEIRATAPDRSQVLWKQPALGEMRSMIDPVFPADWPIRPDNDGHQVQVTPVIPKAHQGAAPQVDVELPLCATDGSHVAQREVVAHLERQSGFWRLATMTGPDA